LSVTHYNNELGEVVEYEMLDPQCLAEMTPLVCCTGYASSPSVSSLVCHLCSLCVVCTEDLIANESVPKIIIKDSILVISNHNSFRVLFDEIASVNFI